LRQKQSKHSKRIVLSLIGEISSTEYYSILCDKIRQSPKDKIPLGAPSYSALEKMNKKQLIYLYDNYSKQLYPNDISNIKRLLYAIRCVAQQQGLNFEASIPVLIEDKSTEK
jgi:hypothetical protein